MSLRAKQIAVVSAALLLLAAMALLSSVEVTVDTPGEPRRTLVATHPVIGRAQP